MNPTPIKVIFSAEGFCAGPGLPAQAEAKAARLSRHERPRISVVRLHLRRETPRHGVVRFAISATAETRGADFVVHSSATEPEAAIKGAFDKLERAVTAAAGLRKVERHAAPETLAYPEVDYA